MYKSFNLLCFTMLASCAASYQPSPAQPQPAIASAELLCDGIRESAFRIRNNDRSFESGWVQVQYSLDGSGSASDVKVIASHNASGFANSVVADLKQAGFKKGVVRDKCIDVRSFQLRRG
jgi:hypothetical protein